MSDKQQDVVRNKSLWKFLIFLPLDSQLEETLRSTIFFLLMGSIGVFSIFIYSSCFWLFYGFFAALIIFSTISITATGFFLVGGFLGFLFGVPRTNDKFHIGEKREENSQSSEQISGKYSESFSVSPNTNLEQISDWFTKILVGVGLTQIDSLLAGVQKLINYLVPAFGGSIISQENSYITEEVVQGYVLLIMIVYSICGFFSFFLWARLYLQYRFTNQSQHELNIERE